MIKNPSTVAGDVREMGLIPGSGRCPGEGNGNLLPVFLPGHFHGQRSLRAMVHGARYNRLVGELFESLDFQGSRKS